jgi:hypothetical protein
MLKPSFIGTVLLLMLAGCSSSDPAQVIEQYLQARITSDVDQLRELACTAWESQVMLEANSFQGREAVLEGATCTTGGTDDAYTIVQCQGKIVVTYQGEQTEFPLGNYRTIQEDGVWKMCGEAG